MTKGSKRLLALIPGVILLFLLSACGPNGGNGGTSTGGASTQHLTTAQLLQSSTDAMKKITSLHFVMNMGVDITGTGATATQTALTLQGSGDEADQNKVSMDMSMNYGSINLKLAEILLNGKIYVKSTKGQWYVMDKTTAGASSLTGTQDYGKFLELAKKGKSTDHGVETYNGERLHHITYTFSKDAVADMLDALGQGNSLTAVQKQELNLFNMSQITLDTWTDDATSYVHHIQMKMGLSINADAQGTPVAAGTPAASGLSMAYTISMDLSKFNEPVTITAPANAISTNSIGSVLA